MTAHRLSGHASDDIGVSDLTSVRLRRAQTNGVVPSTGHLPLPPNGVGVPTASSTDTATPVLASPQTGDAMIPTSERVPNAQSEEVRWTEEMFVAYVIGFSPLTSTERWQRENQLTHHDMVTDHASRLVNHILNMLSPTPAEGEPSENLEPTPSIVTEAETETEANGDGDGVEGAATDSAPPAATSETMIMVGGRLVDISNTGIDPTFLEALPEDLREEVLREHMPPAPATGPASGSEMLVDDNAEISAEFLDALPLDIRQEVIIQQREEQLRRQLQRQRQETGSPAGPAPIIRSTSIAAPSNAVPGATSTNGNKSTTGKKESAQLLDRIELAALARLLFLPAHIPNEGTITDLLLGLCENSKTRADLIGLLLSVLQEQAQTFDDVDRCLGHLAHGSGKSGAGALVVDDIPNLPAQCSLNALIALVERNPSAVQFFLSENEHLCLRKPAKKGSGHKSRDPIIISKYPVVILLSLVDRPAVVGNVLIIETLTFLLATICRPLPTMARRSQRHQLRQAESERPNDSTPTPVTDPESGPKLPDIPAHYTRAVVNILTTGECTSKTFQNTLTLIQYLSVLEDAGRSIIHELVQCAERLAEAVSLDLDTLVPVLAQSEDIDTTDNAALRQFTAPSANQTKMLRVLKALDYVHTKIQSQQNQNTPPEAMEVDPAVMADDQTARLATLPTFQALWTKLGRTLKLVQDHSDHAHVATVLLPLIESFMNPEREITSNAAEEFFNQFSENHRKILNALVRNNPSLMSGSFALLVHNPKVLEFDNKRNYFNQQLHRRSTDREMYGALHLNVRRQYVFEDSFHQLQGRSGREIKYGKLAVKFHNEDGVDAGGLTREWFQVLARQMFNLDYALFKSSAVDKVTYQPNPASWVNPDHLTYFKFVGRIIGKAIFDGRLMDCYFTRSFYKHMLGRSVDYRDVEAIDPEYYKSLVWMLENDITDLFDLTFSVEVDEFGKKQTIDLKPQGREIAVTEENKLEYVKLVCEQKLTLAIKDQIDHFLTGFHDVIPRDLVQIFNEQELELLISGLPDIDIDDWKNNTDYHGYNTSSPQIQWFWRAVRSFDQEERAKLLQFVTGTSKVPLQGFIALQGSSGVQKFQIHKDFASTARLPCAHTCFNQLDIPLYESYEQLRSQLLLAINECSTGFGFA
ncbi:hypothetical protein BJ085DRAFT_20779 [Dimargaris cristalligena]|uniref:HECT-type E3 ubiquitin transferase n=1 Tax=Dimargaris cristalligena TaxID=215637 RepID=A0A4Q0A347_9FUNG|nr:hypothetical protein BJ085DRAFT_20779 [Dimargaris cristalligena]|eukprot:RKP39991.1 hypothetical protein BJ085DRAFT_20779 [Dimargaris cristalligena]